jgi:hypothetical protein
VGGEDLPDPVGHEAEAAGPGKVLFEVVRNRVPGDPAVAWLRWRIGAALVMRFIVQGDQRADPA